MSVIFYFFAKKESNHEEISEKAKLCDILQNNWLLVTENAKIMKHKEILRSCVSQIRRNYGDRMQCGILALKKDIERKPEKV